MVTSRRDAPASIAPRSLCRARLTLWAAVVLSLVGCAAEGPTLSREQASAARSVDRFAVVRSAGGGEAIASTAPGSPRPDSAPAAAVPAERGGAIGPALALMPEPASVERHPGSLVTLPKASVRYTGFSGGRIPAAVARFEARLPLAVPTGGEASANRSAGRGARPLRLTIECSGAARLEAGEEESYRLSVSAGGAVLSAPTDLGVLHGLVTLAQLASPLAESPGREGSPPEAIDGLRPLAASGGPAASEVVNGSFPLSRPTPHALAFPYVTIRDRPRYTWRGLLIDSARHFLPISAIKRTLTGMEEVKLNVLHWHLSDDQGFRVESLRYPLLQEDGSDGQFYTQDEIREIVAFADARGIRVVPEFDIPAHTTSWFVGYPELASAPGPYRVERRFGVFNAVMDPAREATYRFLAGFFAEMATLFPDDYVHIGGDENTGVDWANNPEILAFMREHGLTTTAALQAYFSRRVAKILAGLGKRVIGWNEILMPHLPTGTLIDVWTTPLAAFEAAISGYGSVLSRGYYLDAMEPAGDYYARDPGPLVEGGEASMWGELVDGTNLDERVWPRAAAIAERFWSPASVTNVADMYRRLGVESLRLTSLGLTQQSGYEARLQELLGSDARTGDLARLRLFVDSLRPLGLYGRTRARHYTTATAFDRVVDAARPDSALARALSSRVDRFLAEAPADRATAAGFADGEADLRAALAALRDNDRFLAPLLLRSARLREVRRLSAELSQLGQMGVDALDHLSTGRRLHRGACLRAQALLERAARPEAEVRLAVIDPVSRLVSAACGR